MVRGADNSENEGILQVMELFYTLIVVQDYMCMSRLLELYSKSVYFTECKLHLSKSDPSKKERIHSCKILNA